VTCLLAICLQLGLGLTHANPQDCGIFYLCDQPANLHLNTLSWSAGVESETFRAGYEHLGSFRTDGLVDGDWMHASGSVEGVYTQFVARQKDWWVGIGTWEYRAGVSLKWRQQPDQGGAFSIGPMVSVGNKYLQWNIRVTPARGRDANGNNFPSPVKAFTQSVSVNFTF